MKKSVTFALAFITIAASMLVPARADTIQITQVDSGQYPGAIEISTPWGDYVAIDEGGGTYWVGAYKDYEHARVIGIARDLGMRVSTVKAPGATETFVDEDSLHADVGSTHLDAITPSIDFYENTGSRSTKVVDVTWTASGEARCFFYSPTTHHTYVATDFDYKPPFRNETFVLPKSLLTKRMLLVFVKSGVRPAVLPITSIAGLDYRIIYHGDTAAGLTPDAQEQKHLNLLRKLDPNIHAAATPAPEPQPTGLALLHIYTFKAGDYPYHCDAVLVGKLVHLSIRRGDRFRIDDGDDMAGYTVEIMQHGRFVGDCHIDTDTLNTMAGFAP